MWWRTAFTIFAIFNQTKLACERGQILSILCDDEKVKLSFESLEKVVVVKTMLSLDQLFRFFRGASIQGSQVHFPFSFCNHAQNLNLILSNCKLSNRKIPTLIDTYMQVQKIVNVTKCFLSMLTCYQGLSCGLPNLPDPQFCATGGRDNL